MGQAEITRPADTKGLRQTPGRPNYAADAIELPDPFIDWALTERRDVFDAIERDEMPTSFASHLPVVNTLGTGHFPVHSATKGAGLTPTDEALPDILEACHDVLRWCEGRDWKSTMPERVAVTKLLYDHPERLDRGRFGLIEIFKGNTYRNIVRDPRVTLLFTGPWPRYVSFQVNCTAEIVDREDPRFAFVQVMRELFERDRFHIQQPDYPVVYMLWVNEVVDKAPRFGQAGKRVVGRSRR